MEFSVVGEREAGVLTHHWQGDFQDYGNNLKIEKERVIGD